jgi:hypothetical protein
VRTLCDTVAQDAVTNHFIGCFTARQMKKIMSEINFDSFLSDVDFDSLRGDALPPELEGSENHPLLGILARISDFTGGITSENVTVFLSRFWDRFKHYGSLAMAVLAIICKKIGAAHALSEIWAALWTRLQRFN